MKMAKRKHIMYTFISPENTVHFPNGEQVKVTFKIEIDGKVSDREFKAILRYFSFSVDTVGFQYE